MRPLRFALIGCGQIAKKHAESLRRLANANLVAVCDTHRARAENFAKLYEVAPYIHHEQMLEQQDIDVVCVLTPSGDHAKSVMDLVPFGKHIVVEKPIALCLQDAERITQACKQAGIELFVVKQNRFNLPVQALRTALEQGRFGKLVLGTVRVRWCRTQEYYDAAPWRGSWQYDGGVLTNQASHHIDLLRWIMGEVESVSAMTATSLANIEAEDVAVASLRFRNGALGVVEATTAARPKDLEGSISILGEKGSVVIGGFATDRLQTWQFAQARAEDADIFTTHAENPKDFAWNHTQYLAHVVESLQTQSSPLVDGLEAKKSIELIHAIYEAAETGQKISFPFQTKHSKLGRQIVDQSANSEVVKL